MFSSQFSPHSTFLKQMKAEISQKREASCALLSRNRNITVGDARL
jgi:hypothetical protein